MVLPTPVWEGTAASGWQRTDLAGSCAAPVGITTRSGFILLARLILKVLGVLCSATAREKLKHCTLPRGTAWNRRAAGAVQLPLDSYGINKRARSAPAALRCRESHADGMNNVWLAPADTRHWPRTRALCEALRYRHWGIPLQGDHDGVLTSLDSSRPRHIFCGPCDRKLFMQSCFASPGARPGLPLRATVPSSCC